MSNSTIEQLVDSLENESFTVRMLYVVESGSRLYGTSTPTSDTDYKGIYLPNKQEWLFGDMPTSIDLGSGDNNTSNTKDDVDCDFYSIESWLHKLQKGIPEAVEMLFSMWSDNVAFQNKEFVDWCKTNYLQLVGTNPKAFTGFAIGQARRYGVKGNRYNEFKQLHELAISLSGHLTPDTKIADPAIQRPIKTLINKKGHLKYIKYTQAPAPRGVEGNWTYLEVLDKLHAPTITLRELLVRLNELDKSYGDRVKTGTDDGIDWKALSHSVRASYELIELITTKKIVFPLADAGFFLEIKKGKLGLDFVVRHLEAKIKEADALIETTEIIQPNEDLPEAYIQSLYKDNHAI